MKQAKHGLFITFEGVDGSGKSTQWQAVGEALKAQHPEREIVMTRNPGGTAFGKEIRALLLTPRPEGEAPVSAMAELMLYMADRAQHVDEVVRPALQRGAIVLCDRFVDSSVAYQGAARGLAPELILQLNAMACAEIAPDLTLLFDADVEVLAQRVAQRGKKDRLELEGLAFQQKVQAGFHALAKAAPQRVKVLDATQAIATLTSDALYLVAAKLNAPCTA